MLVNELKGLSLNVEVAGGYEAGMPPKEERAAAGLEKVRPQSVNKRKVIAKK